MFQFKIKLADRIIRIESMFEDVAILCREYRVDDTTPEDFCIIIKDSDIENERVKSVKYEERNGLRHREYSDGYIETLAVYRKIAAKMPEYDTVLFHGSAVAVDGEAYLFTALSGTGKSTHRRLWQKVYGDRVTVINDDKPLIRVDGDDVYIYGTPWDGKHRASTNTSARLKAICILERGEINKINQIQFIEALPDLMQQFYKPDTNSGWTETLDVLDKIALNVKFYRLSCNKDPEAALVSYEGMSQ